MADFEKVQLQVEVIRTQLDALVKDVNSLKNQKLTITIDSSGLEAVNKFNGYLQLMSKNAEGLKGKVTEIWSGLEVGDPAAKVTVFNEGLGKVRKTLETLTEDGEGYATVQTTITTNYDQMAKAAQKASEQSQKAEAQAKAYLLTQEQVAQKAASVYNPTAIQKQIEAMTGVSSATKSAAESARVFEKAWADASGKSTAAAQKAEAQAKKAASTTETLRKGFADLSLQMQSAGSKYPSGTFDTIQSDARAASAALEELYTKWRNGEIDNRTFINGVQEASDKLKTLRADFAQAKDGTQQLERSTNQFSETLGSIAKKFSVWQLMNAGINQVIRSFREALSTMKEVDTELTAIQKVTNNTDAEMAKLSEHAYDVASQYGVAVSDYLESTGTFAKAGYKELSEDMAELATKTQLVGDVNAETANKFLLAADAAFQMQGNVDDLSSVLDKANEIENHYATSIEKMAEGFPVVANVASMANMSIDELLAGLGTITAVTQESGAMAARALRSLILNILGDTETELEEGVTWTKEEIESLNQVLWTYSEDAMKAAQATGEIVNPMKAVAGLAQAYKEGVLTQAELAKIESDLGGKLRTNQLDALIKNYDMYSAMLDKVSDSAGSADKEVSVMLNSWQSKTNILDNKWTEFISHMLDTDLIKGALDGVIKTVEFLDTDFGHFVVTVAGVSTAVISLVSVFKALSVAIAALNMSSLITPLGIIAATVGALVYVIQDIKKSVEAVVESNKFENLVENYKKLSEEVDSTSDSLEQCRKRLEELNKVEPADRTAAWDKETEELNRQIEALEFLLELRKKESEETARKAYTSDRTVGVKATASVTEENIGDITGAALSGVYLNKDDLSEEQVAALTAQYDSLEEALREVSGAFQELWTDDDLEKFSEAVVSKDSAAQMEIMQQVLGRVGISFQEAKVSAEEFQKTQGNLMRDFSASVEASTDFTAAMREQRDEYIQANRDEYEYLSTLETLTESQSEFVDGYKSVLKVLVQTTDGLDDAASIVTFLGNKFGYTVDEAFNFAAAIGAVDSRAVGVKETLVTTADGVIALKSNCKQLEDGTWELVDVQDALTDASDENASAVSKQVEALQKLSETLKTQKSDLNAAVSALAEYKTYGSVSASTMQNLVGMSEKYVEMLVDEDGQLRITEESLRAVVAAIYENVDATEDQISAAANADAAADSYVEALLNVAESAGYSGKKLYELVLEEIKLNSTGLDLSQQIAQVVALGRAAGATAASIAAITGVNSSNADRTIRGWLQTGQIKSYEEGEQKLLQGVFDSFDFSESSWSSGGSGSSGGGGGGSSSDARLSALKERVTLLKSELTLMEKQGASEDAQKSKMREIQDALRSQANYLESIGGSQSDINDLSSEWYDWQKKINAAVKSTEDLLAELKNALQESLDSEADSRDAALEALDAELEALKKRKEIKDDQVTLEEKELKIQQAQADLENARKERTVRQYNARTGQWEWVADEGSVKSAEEALENAKKDLEDFQDDLAYNAAVAEIEARKDAINAQYDALERQYKNFLNSLKEKTRGIAEILQDIWKNATPELKKIILENAALFKQFGIDVTKLSDAVNETVNRIVKVRADGTAPGGLSVGDRVVTGGGTYEITGVNADGTYQSKIVDKNQTTYNYTGSYDDAPDGSSSGNSGSFGGSSGGVKYSGTVYAIADDGSGRRYTISSPRGLDFLNYEAPGARMTGGDGTSWYKNANGTTSITKKDGSRYTVYDRGGILEGIGGIKATEEPEMVLPPDITKAIQNMLLVPQADARFESGMDRMRAALGLRENHPDALSGARYDNHSVGTQQNGCNFYDLGGIVISEAQARGMTVAELARAAKTLAISKNM